MNYIFHYFQSLDWAFIITFIILAYGLNQVKITSRITRKTGFRLRTRYRTAILGVLYGTFLYFIRDYEITHLENLLQSFVFALVFHKLLLELALKSIREKLGNHQRFNTSNPGCDE